MTPHVALFSDNDSSCFVCVHAVFVCAFMLCDWQKMRLAGINVFPEEDSYKYVKIPDKVGYEIFSCSWVCACHATVCAFSCLAGAKNVMIARRAWHIVYSSFCVIFWGNLAYCKVRMPISFFPSLFLSCRSSVGCQWEQLILQCMCQQLDLTVILYKEFFGRTESIPLSAQSFAADPQRNSTFKNTRIDTSGLLHIRTWHHVRTLNAFCCSEIQGNQTWINNVNSSTITKADCKTKCVGELPRLRLTASGKLLVANPWISTCDYETSKYHCNVSHLLGFNAAFKA